MEKAVVKKSPEEDDYEKYVVRRNKVYFNMKVYGYAKSSGDHSAIFSTDRKLFWGSIRVRRHMHSEFRQREFPNQLNRVGQESNQAYLQRDYFDAGALIYEHVPLLGGVIRFLKSKLA